jgi:AraC-like DNA-binding protein
MPLEIVNLILLLAAAQGLFLSVLIFHKHGRLFANRFLGAMMLMFSLILVHLFLNEQGDEQARPLFSSMLVGLGFLVAPLHYLYAKFLVRRDRPFRKKACLHFLPFLIYESYRLFQYFFARETLFALFSSAKPQVMPFDFIVYNWAVLLQGFIYVQLTIRILNRYARYLKEVFSTLDKIKLDWLRNITLMFAGILAIFLIENALLLAGINLSNYFSLSSTLSAVYVYALGYLGLSKSEVFAEPKIVDSISHLTALSDQNRLESVAPESPVQKYEKSGLSEENAKAYVQQLLELMEKQQPYTNSELTLNQLADMLSISSHNLSEIINTQLQQNFFDFVNGYRLEKVKKDLLDPAKSALTILAIAFDAGFNSKSSFNLIFKKQTNLTPSEFRRQAVEKKV